MCSQRLDGGLLAHPALNWDRAEAQAEAFAVPASGAEAELLAREDIEIVVNVAVPAEHVEVGLEMLRVYRHRSSAKTATGELGPFSADERTAPSDSAAAGAGADDFPVAAKLQAANDLTSAAADGALTVPLGEAYPLEQIAAAHDQVDAGGSGRVLVALPD